MPQLTKNVRKSAFPMQQVIRRLSEIKDNQIMSSKKEKEQKLLFEHNNGPLMPNCKSPQYKAWQNKSFSINTCKIGDSFVELITQLLNPFLKNLSNQITLGLLLYRKIVI